MKLYPQNQPSSTSHVELLRSSQHPKIDSDSRSSLQLNCDQEGNYKEELNLSQLVNHSLLCFLPPCLNLIRPPQLLPSFCHIHPPIATRDSTLFPPPCFANLYILLIPLKITKCYTSEQKCPRCHKRHGGGGLGGLHACFNLTVDSLLCSKLPRIICEYHFPWNYTHN